MASIINWGLRPDRMPEPARPELKPFADKIFNLKYKGREVLAGTDWKRRGKVTYGIAYIPDLRPRAERLRAEPQDEMATAHV
jgi:hypothetical protein